MSRLGWGNAPPPRAPQRRSRACARSASTRHVGPPVCGCPPDGAPHLVSRSGVSVCSFGRSQAAPTRRSTRATTTGTSGSRPACAREARHAPTIRLACPAGTEGLIDSSPSGCWPMNPSQLLYVLVDMQSHETRVQVQPLERKSRRNPGRPFRWLDPASGPGPRRRVALAVVIGGLVLATFGLINISSLLLLASVGVLVAVVRRRLRRQ